MADLLLYVLISVACGLGLVGIIFQIYTHRKKKTEAGVYKEQMQYAVDQTTREMQRFFDMLKMKPTSRGGFGENIVEMVLSNLPNHTVKTQYQPTDISGRIDFTVQLPQSDLLIPIDSKFILPNDFDTKEDFQLDKLSIDALNKKAIRRAKEITKYVDSSETTDFVLMFIPDFVYGVLTNDTIKELSQLKVIPTNTSGLLSTIFMINMQNRFIKLNSAANKFGDLQIRVCQGVTDVVDKMKTGTSQLQYCLNNISDAVNELSKLNTILETLDLE
ncbi:MAG: DNA recombination protein RmuC [Candidatus Thorarchaeota archaeon]